MTESVQLETVLAQAGCSPDPATGAVVAPIHLATTFEREPDGSYPRGYMYSRSENPTRRQLEETLAQLEGGAVGLAFASGMAACHAVLQSLQPGDHIIMADDAYYGVRRLLRTVFSEWGLLWDEVDLTDAKQVAAAARENTRMVWAETPSNPLLKMTDLSAVAAAAKDAGALLVVDNTWATPLLQRPFQQGADIVVHSVTKYLSGHSDVLGGAVIFASESDKSAQVRNIQVSAGAVMDPFSAWLTLRGMRSLSARLNMQCHTARQLAAFLNNHARVSRTHFPGLMEHPGHEIALHQMRDFGGMISVEIAGGREEAMRVASRVAIFRRATSLGGTESLIEHRASIEAAGGAVPENLLRLSVGLEHPDDLVSDLSQALSD